MTSGGSAGMVDSQAQGWRDRHFRLGCSNGAIGGRDSCSCAVVFQAFNVSRGIWGACALRCLSPQGPYSWDSRKYSLPYYAKQTYFLSPQFCHCY